MKNLRGLTAVRVSPSVPSLSNTNKILTNAAGRSTFLRTEGTGNG
jgi:hypothetical protein